MTDMITMQVIRYGLEQVADEMGYTLVRTGRFEGGSDDPAGRGADLLVDSVADLI